MRAMLTSAVVAALLVGAFVTYNSANETYSTLFSQLEREDAAAVVAKLKEMKVPFRLGADGTSIDVPDAKARELRLELAGAGLPRGGSVGFETFDKAHFGATEFEERVMYRRALEGEIARTIGTIAAVQSARVHLVLPEKSVFVSKSEPTSASVVLKMRPGRHLGPSEITGVVHLVASSVTGLVPDHVALLTTDGAVLHKPRTPRDDGVEAEGEQGAQQRATESALEDRARTMLEKVVGPGHVDVRVTAEMDYARVERTEEHYDPKSSTLRSEERTVERNGTPSDDVAGVPGAESNLPSGAARGAASASASAAAAPPPADGTTRESHTRNYEIDKVSEKRIVLGGTLKRVTVAAVLDGVAKTENGATTVVPRGKEELDRFAALVRSAVGADAARGDVVTVDSLPFLESDLLPAPPPPAPPPSAIELVRKHPKAYLPAAGAAILLTIVVMVSAARRRRRARAAEAGSSDSALQLTGSPRPAELEGPPPVSLPELRSAAHERAAADPATAALVMRFWLGSSESVEQHADSL